MLLRQTPSCNDYLSVAKLLIMESGGFHILY